MSYDYHQWAESAFSAGEIQQPGVADLITGIVGEGSVFDIGCGNGRFCTVFNPKGYLGIDLSPISIATASQIHPEYTFKTEDLVTYTPSKTFDYVFSWTVLEHIPPSFMPELSKKLKKIGKKLLLGEPQPDGNVWAEHCHPHNYEDYFTITNKHQISNSFYLLEAEGNA